MKKFLLNILTVGTFVVAWGSHVQAAIPVKLVHNLPEGDRVNVAYDIQGVKQAMRLKIRPMQPTELFEWDSPGSHCNARLAYKYKGDVYVYIISESLSTSRTIRLSEFTKLESIPGDQWVQEWLMVD